MPCRVIDSTGIKVRSEGEWHAREHGGARRRLWRKVHLAVDEATLEVRAVEMTGSGVARSRQIASQSPVGQWTRPCCLACSVRSPRARRSPPSPPLSGSCFARPCRAVDGAYDTRGCRNAIVNGGADAIIPRRRNAKPWKKDSPGAAGRNEALRAIKRLGRTIWRRWSGYHRRSRAETKPLGTLLRNTLPANE